MEAAWLGQEAETGLLESLSRARGCHPWQVAAGAEGSVLGSGATGSGLLGLASWYPGHHRVVVSVRRWMYFSL